MEAQLKLWSSRIEKLAAGARKAGARTGIVYFLSIDDLKVKRALAQAKVEEFKAAGSAKQTRLKAGIARAWNDLEDSFTDLKR